MNKKSLNVLFVETTNSGVAYWRMYNFLQAAHRNRVFHGHMLWWKWDQHENEPNWEIDITDPQYKARILNELDQKVRQADVVIMQMVHFQASLDVFMGIKEMYPNVRLVAECDDNFISTSPDNPAFSAYIPGSDFRSVAVQQFKIADALIVSTPYLKDVYSEFNDNIYVVPNSIDKKFWNVKKDKKRPGIRIGWAGSGAHTEDLRIIEPIIKKILDRHKDVRFCFVHGIPDFLKNRTRVECIQKFVEINKYPKFISNLDFDIGIAPLVDNAFNRGKSNIRWLENAALGIPVVASRVGHFAETIIHGQDGFLASDTADFEHYLEQLITDRRRRIEMGLKAKEKSLSVFNVDNTIHDYNIILKEIIARGWIEKNEAKIRGEDLMRGIESVQPGALIQ